MRNAFKLGLVIGVVSIVASGMPACGGDSSSDDGKKTGGTGGKDGSATGATGGYGATGGASGGAGGASGGAGGTSGGSGGTGGGVTTKTCGSETCKGYNIANVVTIDPCCAGSAQDKCGVDITDQIASQINIKPGCFELNQEGNPDPICPPIGNVPIIGSLPGCCNKAKSQCSFVADISGLGGPNIGCVDPSNLPPSDAGPPKDCVPGQPGDGGPEGGGTGGSGGSDASTADATSD